MSNASDAFVRVPPDSTGKRVHAAERTVVYFDNLQTGQSFSVGQTVVGSVSSAQGEIVGITTVGFTSGKGYLWIEDITGGSYTNDEQLQVDAVYIANVNTDTAAEGGAVTTIYTQHTSIVDGNNMSHSVEINDEGELLTRLPKVQISENGANITTTSSPVFTQVFNYDYDDPDLFNNQITVLYNNPVNTPFTAGKVVKGQTSNATAIVLSTDTSNNLLYLHSVEGNFQDGETIRSKEVDPIQSVDVVKAPTVTLNTLTKAVDLDTDGQNAGLKVTRSSNVYFPFGNGRATEITMGMAHSSEQEGVTRRYGMFDDDNGFFWEVIQNDGSAAPYDPSSSGVNTGGETELCVVHRTNADGSVEDNQILQSNFNVNKLDGSDSNGFSLDITRANLFWIDIPNNGAGSARFGVYNEEGRKIIAHIFDFNNAAGFTYNPTPVDSLPIRAEVVNHGGSAAVSNTTMKINKITVYKLEEDQGGSNSTSFHHGQAMTRHVAVDNTRGQVPIFGLQARQEINGIDNRMFAKIQDFNVSLIDTRLDRTFDGASVSSNQITLRNHGLQDGDSIQYLQNGQTTAVSGLDDYGKYYAIAVDDDTVALATGYYDSIDNATGIPLGTGSPGNHKLIEPSDAPVTFIVRKNADVADAVWSSHNAARAGTEWQQDGTGFRIDLRALLISDSGTGYAAGDLLELDSSQTNRRQAVLQVLSTGVGGAIDDFIVAPATTGHQTELDGVSNANYGSYLGMIMDNPVGHKAGGVGLSETAGSNATFNITANWGHGFWWATFYGLWNEFSFNRESIDSLGKIVNFDTYFGKDAVGSGVGGLTLTAQVSEKVNFSKILTTMNWREIL